MGDERGAAIINAAVARALIRAAGMTAENQARASRGEVPAHNEEHFERLIDEEGIGWNAVMETLRP